MAKITDLYAGTQAFPGVTRDIFFPSISATIETDDGRQQGGGNWIM